MRATVTLQGRGIFAALAEAIHLEARTTASAMAKQQVKNIKTRTQWAAGADDAPMPGLTSGYAKYKRGAAIRNLRQSGQMMRDIKAEGAKRSSSGWEAFVAFSSSRSARIAAFNQARYAWFAFSPNDTQMLLRLMTGFGARVGARLSGGGR